MKFSVGDKAYAVWPKGNWDTYVKVEALRVLDRAYYVKHKKNERTASELLSQEEIEAIDD